MEPNPAAPPPRERRLARLLEDPLDVLVVGGGITGAGLAHDLAARGLEVGLVERGDWASATSSASSRLVHGGLRYLEQLELGLVRESCIERAILLEQAAGLVWPERFTYALHEGAGVGIAKLGAGLLLYTAVSLPRPLGLPRLLSGRAVARALPGVRADGLRGGGSYLDGATDDARLTLAVVATAGTAGARCVSRVEALELEGGANGVEARLADRLGDERWTVRARAAVLAGGPFTDTLRARAGLGDGRWVAPTRGSHVTVPRERLPTDGAAILTSRVDGRVLFLIPWPRYTVIGTTDLDADPSTPVRATRAEVRYLLDSANGLVPAAELGEEDVVSTWAGLRPLLAAPESDPSARSREERVARDGALYTIAGGKLTGFRAMAETLGARLASDLGKGDKSRRSPTRRRRLVGAEASRVERPRWSSLAEDGRPRADSDPVATAWRARYGALVPEVAEACQRVEEGLRPFDEQTLFGELDWAVRREDCLTAEDFLFRRTDLGLEPRAAVEAALPLVLDRMAALVAWPAERVDRERGEALAALAARHAWRADP